MAKKPNLRPFFWSFRSVASMKGFLVTNLIPFAFSLQKLQLFGKLWFLLQKGVLLLFSYFVSFFWVFSLLLSVSAFQLQIHCKTIKPNTFDRSMKLYNYLVVFDALRWLNKNSKFLSLGVFSTEYNFWAKKCNAVTLVHIKRDFSKEMWASLLLRVPIFFVIKCQLYFRKTQNGESSETQEFDIGSYWQRSEYFSKTQTNLTQKGNWVAQSLGQLKISLGLDNYIDVEKTPLLIWEFLWVSWSIQKTMNLIFLINFENRMFDKKNGRQIRYFAKFRSISTAVKVKKYFITVILWSLHKSQDWVFASTG